MQDDEDEIMGEDEVMGEDVIIADNEVIEAETPEDVR
jgi:hypothetical protein